MGQKVERRAVRLGGKATSGTGGGRGRGRREAQEGAPRASLYDSVTNQIIAELEDGRLPWVQPWSRSSGASAALPHNAKTGRAYSGINILILWGAVIEAGWPSQGWLTFRQALEAGGNVRKGERGTTVVYADRFIPKGETERAARDGSDVRAVPFLKSFTLFNVAQCENLPEGFGCDAGLAEPLSGAEIMPVAEAVIAAAGVPLRIGGDEAFYVPAHDFIQMPPPDCFKSGADYYCTALHELTHATGHVSRLDRKLLTSRDTKDYAREELVAEMGSAFLCAALGIEPIARHADYIGGWLAILREDNRAIFRAASLASKAADWLLARHAEADAGAVAARCDIERRAAA